MRQFRLNFKTATKQKVLIIENSAFSMKVFRSEFIMKLCKFYDVYLACPYTKEFQEYFESIGCTCINTHIDRRGTNPLKDFLLFINYLQIFYKFKPHIVFTYSIKPNIYAGFVCQLFKIPYIATVEGLGSAFTRHSFFYRCLKHLYFLGMRSAKTVFYLNDHIYKTLNELGIKKEQLSYTPGMGANLSVFIPTAYPKDDSYKLLTVGRIMREKGIPEMLEASDILAKELPGLEWHICGSPEAGEGYLVDELIKRKNIVYHGQQSDMRPFYELVHATATTTYHEGMSTICLESAACARPVLGTHIHGVFETIEEHSTGFTFPAHDVKATVETIKKFFTLPNETRRDMGLAARRKIEKEFDRKIMVQTYLSKIKEILAEK